MTRLRKMRIVYVNHTGHISGAERILLDMLHVLDRERFEPVVLCPQDGRLADEVRAESVPCLPLPAVSARFAMRPDRLLRAGVLFAKAIAALRKHILQLRPDLVHANTIRAGIAVTIGTSWTPIPVVWHVHDILPKHALSTAIRAFARASKRTHIVAVSHAAAKEFCGVFDFGGRVRTIHNGVDLAKFPAKTNTLSKFREEHHIPADSFLLCAVGQICARKGLHELVEAFRKIHQYVPRMHLAIVGRAVFAHEEGYLESLKQAAAVSGCSEGIHFTGELRNVSSVLQASDLLVLNSRQEPFGLVLVEAMSSGTPVLATRVGGIPEIVSDGVNGWLVDSSDAMELASKLLELSRNPDVLKQAAQAGQGITCRQFSRERFKRSLCRLYSEFDVQGGPGWIVQSEPALSRLEEA